MGSEQDFKNAAPGVVGYTLEHPAAARTTNDANGRLLMAGRKNIAICGFASSSRHLIPTDDPAWLIIGLNQLYRHMPRADAWFDIHVNFDQHNVEGTDHSGWLRECGIPVYMSAVPSDVPNATNYPVERLIQKFGVDYFTSTVSFMIALAIDSIDGDIEQHGGERSDYTIGIFGIDLIVGTEYDVQKACAEFWIGVASGKGINVLVPPMSALLKQSHRYGYQIEPDSGLFGLAELEARVAELNGFTKKAQPQLHALNGAQQVLADLLTKDGIKGNEAAEKLIKQGLDEANSKVGQMIAEIQTYDGAAQEAQHHVNVMTLRQRGGVVPLAQTRI